MIELGQKVRDSISGFEGIATARAEFLHGCIRIQVSPTKLQENGQPIEGQYFDEAQLVPQKEPIQKKPKSGSRQDFPSREG